jgi:hypothetical protein
LAGTAKRGRVRPLNTEPERGTREGDGTGLRGPLAGRAPLDHGASGSQGEGHVAVGNACVHVFGAGGGEA